MSARAIARLNPEPNLITQARNGDLNAFAVLYKAHKPRMQAVCLRMTNNIAEAEDLTQYAFIYVFRNISTFRGDSTFSTWIHRVTVNTVLMHFRRKSKRLVSLEHPNPQDSDGPKHEYGGVDEKLAACADRLALIKAIEELPPGYRTIFLLHEVQGYEHKEIARRLQCSIGNSKSQLHKAKLRMRELLATHGYTYRQRVATVKPTAFGARVPVEMANISGLALSSTDASTGLPNQLPETGGNERKDYVPRPLSDAASTAYEKRLSRRKNSTGLSFDSNPQIMLPGVRQANPAVMAESGF